MLEIERQLWREGVVRLAGVDEAGRGPLAGPVVAAAVGIGRTLLEAEAEGLFAGVIDSKQLTPGRREAVFGMLRGHPAIQIGVGRAEHDEIDRVNILQATHRAMARAVAALPCVPEHILVDGRAVPGLPAPSTALVGGDGRSLLIAAASIVAKVVRDRWMIGMDGRYPAYGFARHKGYGSREHMAALFEHGPCPIHRRSFRPVREAAAIHAAHAGTGGRPRG